MTYKAALIDNVYVVRWQDPEKPDPNRIFREVAQASKATGGKIIYLSISPEGSPPPDRETRQEMVRIFEHLNQHCAAMHLVYEAKGFKASIKRNVMTGILLANHRVSDVKVHKSVDEALQEMGDAVDLERLRSRLDTLGLSG